MAQGYGHVTGLYRVFTCATKAQKSDEWTLSPLEALYFFSHSTSHSTTVHRLQRSSVPPPRSYNTSSLPRKREPSVLLKSISVHNLPYPHEFGEIGFSTAPARRQRMATQQYWQQQRNSLEKRITTLTNDELKTICRAYGYQVSGIKSTLQKRCLEGENMSFLALRLWISLWEGTKQKG